MQERSEIKPYWIKREPGLSPHLMYGTGPFTMCVAIVCNMDWARNIRDSLNANAAVSGPAVAGTLDRPCSTGGQHGND